MGDAISILYTHRLEEKELLERHNIIKDAKQKNDGVILNDFINKKVHPKFQSKLVCLIENYTDDVISSLISENEQLYREGFNACLDIIFNSRNS